MSDGDIREALRCIGAGIRSGCIAAGGAMVASSDGVDRMGWAMLVGYLVYLSVRWEFDR